MSDLKRFKKFIDSKADKEIMPIYDKTLELIAEYETKVSLELLTKRQFKLNELLVEFMKCIESEAETLKLADDDLKLISMLRETSYDALAGLEGRHSRLRKIMEGE